MYTPARPVVVLVATGGTIASAPEHTHAGVAPSLTASDLLAGVPESHALADVRCIQVTQKPSVELEFEDLPINPKLRT